MTRIKIFIWLSLIILVVGSIYVWDQLDRNVYCETCISAEEMETFSSPKSIKALKSVYIENFGNPVYNFPRTSVKSIKVFKNRLILSRLSAVTISERELGDWVEFFNNPDNFTWKESDWTVKDSEFVVRFYDDEAEEVGKVWICRQCQMTKSIPFCPNMKFGGLSADGMTKIQDLLSRR